MSEIKLTPEVIHKALDAWYINDPKELAKGLTRVHSYDIHEQVRMACTLQWAWDVMNNDEPQG